MMAFVPEMILLTAYGALLWTIESLLNVETSSWIGSDIGLRTITMLGFSISLLLVFRTNSAYERWWEGRIVWGALVNDTRNLAIRIRMMFPDQADRKAFAIEISNFADALRDHLRDGCDSDRLENGFADNLYSDALHVPNAIVARIYEKVSLRSLAGDPGSQTLVIDQILRSMIDDLGRCERIRNSPIPQSYEMFLKRVLFIFVILVPIAMLGVAGPFSGFVAIPVFYVLVGLEAIAEEIEEPFGRDPNDLPTDQLSAMIRRDVGEILR